MKPRELENLGVPRGAVMKLALELCGRAAEAGVRKDQMRSRIAAILAFPATGADDPHFGELARELADKPMASFTAREAPAPWKQWGVDLEPHSVEQMVNACQLPVAVAGALMPDAHVGYGLPIGGVLATDNAVIPYAVGVDIACRMKLTVLNVTGGAHALKAETDRLIHALERQTRFGMGASFQKPHQHDVMDDDWSISPITRQYKDKAWSQLGTSGSGNHFVEYGTLTLDRDELGLEAGVYLALLSHSGSRGTGALVADHYSKLAMSLHPELPRHLKHLAWLDLDTEAGQEFWAAMNLMGHYAAANHAIIHRSIARALDADVLLDVENHHNFAWKEEHVVPAETEASKGGSTHPPAPTLGGRRRRSVIVHRKGATPAGPGVLGIIPGSMASPGFIVRGRGSEASLQSASHGAGRVMSRTQARSTFTWSAVKKQLAERDVILLSAGLDEVPGVYKDIHQVMSQQQDLVQTVARFDPRIVKMAPAGERGGLMSYVIDDPSTGLATPCERILRSLPEWFGIEQAIVDYVRAIDQLPTFLARDVNGEAIGFMSVKRHFPLAAELYVLGIRTEHHRRGVGRMLLEAVEAWLGRDSVRVLQVKTLSPARASAAYDATRRYYEAMGFIPIEEFPTLWGERNPCVMMAKVLR